MIHVEVVKNSRKTVENRDGSPYFIFKNDVILVAE